MSAQAPSAALLWFRKDLRLDDNLALIAAARSGRPIVPVYILDPNDRRSGSLGAAQDWWLHHSLAALGDRLQALGSRLVIRQGEALPQLQDLCRQTGARKLVCNRRYDPPGATIDKAVSAALADDGIETESHAGQLLHDPARLLTGSGGPYRVYTPFWKTLERSGEPREPVEAPANLAAPSTWPPSEKLESLGLLPRKPDWASAFSEVWTPGEAAALEKLETFLEDGLDGYETGRDFPAKPATSLLSPHLALGEISPYRIWHATRGLKVSSGDLVRFRKELAWREFCYHLLFHFPELADKNWNNRFDDLRWHSNEKTFRRWTEGNTGYPIVDAGMRQLWRHGFMHNRVRMITASFLVKDLMIDWREGERWFRETLVDADPASNGANWQWVAGTGADASPFFRIFNPTLQGEKFDPEGNYVRQFVPEIAGLDNKYIHRPSESPAKALEKAGITLGETYPRPIVDHGKARTVALAAYGALKEKS
ncbi:deoxyribodipyrimidine photo-lyase [Rhizobium sp. LjRoot30]|uniref:cryptochrome/photolyase family protein n=1 Tax=Rhizobium sp. LjRoot30 TaxID=3342320 RepID=UPI003ECC7EE2